MVYDQSDMTTPNYSVSVIETRPNPLEQLTDRNTDLVVKMKPHLAKKKKIKFPQ